MPDPVTLIDRAREHLSEAARWAVTHPAEARRLGEEAYTLVLQIRNEKPGLCWDVCHRLKDNLAVGLRVLESDPGVFRGYAHGANCELYDLRRLAEGREEPG